MNDRLLTRAQVAAELSCSTSTVKRRIRTGELPAVFDGRLVRVRESDLRRYVLERLARRTGSRAVEASGVVLPAGARLYE
jgi:excisionase family DNA binding protein